MSFFRNQYLVVGGGDGEAYVSAVLKYLYRCAEVGVSRYASHEYAGGQGLVGKFVMEVIPSAEVAHYAFERLIFEDEASVSPGCDHAGINYRHVDAVGCVVEYCLVTLREEQFS